MSDDAQVVSAYCTKRTAEVGQEPGLHLFWAPCPKLPPIPKGPA